MGEGAATFRYLRGARMTVDRVLAGCLCQPASARHGALAASTPSWRTVPAARRLQAAACLPAAASGCPPRKRGEDGEWTGHGQRSQRR